MTNATHEVAVAAFKSLVTRSEAALVKFKTNLDKDALYAFSWGDSAIAAAATLQVAQGALKALALITDPNSEATVETLIEFYRKEVMCGARNPAHSTSQMSNLVRTYVTAAQVQALDILTNYF
jgi:hypothetical protein